MVCLDNWRKIFYIHFAKRKHTILFYGNQPSDLVILSRFNFTFSLDILCVYVCVLFLREEGIGVVGWCYFFRGG